MIEPCSNCGKNYCYGDCYADDAQAMSAGTAKTEGLGGDSPASAARQDAPDTPLSTPLPSGSIER